MSASCHAIQQYVSRRPWTSPTRRHTDIKVVHREPHLQRSHFQTAAYQIQNECVVSMLFVITQYKPTKRTFFKLIF